MQCKIDHAALLAIPAFLCRACHPALNHTPEENAVFWEALRVSQVQENERVRREREISRLRERIAKMRENGGEPEPGTVAGKVYKGLCAKLARLELGEGDAWAI